MKKITLFIIGAFWLPCHNLISQTAVRQETVTDAGSSDTLGILQIVRNTTSSLIITGNSSINATQCNFKTICYDPSGNQTWTQMYNANLGKAYSTAATKDANNNIIVVGCAYTNTTNLQDLTVLKYSSAGALLWTYTYNGGNNDVATDVVCDPTGKIYVTGARTNSGTDVCDYVTIGLTANGTQLWTPVIYNYNNLLDIPMGIKWDPAGTGIIVSGTSGSTFNNYDVATVKYNPSTGALLSSDRQTSNAAAFNMGADLTSDASGNVYYTGRVWNGYNFDVQVVKYNSSLVLQWSKTFNGHNLDDGGTKLALDNAGNVIVTGYATKPISNTKEAIVLKYNSAGTLLWSFPKSGSQPISDNSTGLGVKINSSNEIYIGGNVTKAGNQDVFIMKLDANGTGKFYEQYDGTSHGLDQFFDLSVDAGGIYVTSRSTVSGSLHNLVIKYSERNISSMFVHNIHPAYAANELIISFDPRIINMNTINNRKFPFGQLSDFIPDSICTKIDNKLYDGKTHYSSKTFTCHKVFYDMTGKDSLSTTRLGDVIKVPKFYCTIVVNMPVFTAPMTLQVASDSLNKIKPYIFKSEFNWAFKKASGNGITPNDWYWGNQLSMHTNTIYPLAHINADTAWTVARGNPSVRVGIFDTGIQMSHEDLIELPQNLGQDFSNLNWHFLNNDIDGHGTQMAGLIGATRNNTLGIAGLAGGNDSVPSQGVSIYDCKIAARDQWGADSIIGLDKIAFAMHHSIRGDSSGFAINIANQSFAADSHNQVDSLFKNKTFQDQLIFACRNGVAVTAAKTSYGDFALPCYPADWNPEIMSCVGGSGKDGHRAKWNYANPNLSNCQVSVNFGYNMDFIAPAATTLVATTNSGTNSDYVSTGWGSGACSQVAGTYALMMSYFNQPGTPWDHLLHEDCENILRRTCTDQVDPLNVYGETVGWDEGSGWGKINVSRAIREINRTHYRFRHINAAHATSNSSTSSLIASSVQLFWPAYNALAMGSYVTDIYEVTTTLNYALNAGETIKDYWPMYKECNGWANDQTNLSIDRPYYSKVVSCNNTTAVLKTYSFFNHSDNNYYPLPPSKCTSAITLYTYDIAGSNVGIRENLEANSMFRLRPNPNNGQFNITFGSELDTDMHYKIVDMLGRELQTGSYRSSYGENNISVDISSFPSGLYILNVYDTTKMLYKQKLIKQ